MFRLFREKIINYRPFHLLINLEQDQINILVNLKLIYKTLEH